ncbi:MAG TPA: CPCC family cysteine-rich protein [Polyangia bacterium]|nr:CPCC family cysteine-rich protein [Polyangia bacterium]
MVLIPKIDATFALVTWLDERRAQLEASGVTATLRTSDHQPAGQDKAVIEWKRGDDLGLVTLWANGMIDFDVLRTGESQPMSRTHECLLADEIAVTLDTCLAAFVRANERLSTEGLAQGQRWFQQYCDQLDQDSVNRPPEPGRRFACPCCRFLTLEMRGGFEICPVCFWEDDGQDDHDAADVPGGPNGKLSLDRARANFAAFGACDEGSRAHVRPPRPDERDEAG